MAKHSWWASNQWPWKTVDNDDIHWYTTIMNGCRTNQRPRTMLLRMTHEQGWWTMMLNICIWSTSILFIIFVNDSESSMNSEPTRQENIQFSIESFKWFPPLELDRSGFPPKTDALPTFPACPSCSHEVNHVYITWYNRLIRKENDASADLSSGNLRLIIPNFIRIVPNLTASKTLMQRSCW